MLWNHCWTYRIRPDFLISSFRRHRVISSASMVGRRRRHLKCFTSGTCHSRSIWQSGALHVCNQSPAMCGQETSGRCNIKAWFMARLWSAASGKFKLQSHAHERSYTGVSRSDWNIPRYNSAYLNKKSILAGICLKTRCFPPAAIVFVYVK